MLSVSSFLSVPDTTVYQAVFTGEQMQSLIQVSMLAARIDALYGSWQQRQQAATGQVPSGTATEPGVEIWDEDSVLASGTYALEVVSYQWAMCGEHMEAIRGRLDEHLERQWQETLSFVTTWATASETVPEETFSAASELYRSRMWAGAIMERLCARMDVAAGLLFAAPSPPAADADVGGWIDRCAEELGVASWDVDAGVDAAIALQLDACTHTAVVPLPLPPPLAPPLALPPAPAPPTVPLGLMSVQGLQRVIEDVGDEAALQRMEIDGGGGGETPQRTRKRPAPRGEEMALAVVAAADGPRGPQALVGCHEPWRDAARDWEWKGDGCAHHKRRRCLGMRDMGLSGVVDLVEAEGVPANRSPISPALLDVTRELGMMHVLADPGSGSVGAALCAE